MTHISVLHDPRMAIVEIRGPDAAAFLHAQFTSDVDAMAPGGVALSAWCNPRGQVRNLFWIVRRPGGAGFALVVPAGEADDLVRRLRAFILRAKVEAERTGERVLGACGPGAEAFVADWIGSVPSPGGAIESECRVAIHPPGNPSRFLVLGSGLEPHPVETPDAKWRRIEIAAGIAWLTDESRESFIPQMLNLDRLGALSFEKGCFPGQEVIARTHYLGRLKRRLYRARVEAGPPPAPGDQVRSGDRAAGTFVSVERDRAGEGCELLAVLRIDLVGGRLETEDGRRVRVSPSA